MTMMTKSKRSILIVDDDPDFIELFKNFASIVDHELIVVSAKDAIEGLMKCRNQKFEMIFTDYQMPKFNGVDFIVSVRRSSDNEETPIVLTTTDPDKIEIDKKVLQNIYSLSKPITKKSLEKALNNMPEIVRSPKVQLDPKVINAVIENFQNLLTKIGHFESIVKKETKKLEITSNLVFDYYACLIIRSNTFNGILTVAFPEETFGEFIIESLNRSMDIKSKEELFEAFVQLLVVKTKESLHEMGNQVSEIKSIVGHGHTDLLSSQESFLEFYSTFESSKGEFYVQISVW